MSNDPTPGAARPSLFEHMLIMPRIHKMMLAGAMLLAGGGSFGQIAGYLTGKPTPIVQQQQDQNINAGTQSVEQSNPNTQVEQPPVEPEPTIGQKVSPWATRVGFAFIAGFLIGWVFRAFIKLMSLATMAGVAILGGLSYFHIMNIDFTAVEREYKSNIAWVTDQAERLAQSLLSHIPGSTSSFAGMFIGFKRK